MPTIKRIDQIEITNVKGISHKIFEVKLIPNKPSILVAPNGFGKSSITAGFASMNSKRIELSKDMLHRGDENRLPEVLLRYTLLDNTQVVSKATTVSNEIFNTFDIHVINSQLVSKAKKLKIAGASVVTTAIEVASVTLVKTIPPSAKLTYSNAEVRLAFGKNGKVLPNIGELLNNKELVARLGSEVDFAKQGQVGISKTINSFKQDFNSKEGSVADILGGINTANLEGVAGVPYLLDIVNLLKAVGTTYEREVDYYLAAVQIADIHAFDKTGFRKAVDFSQYQVMKVAYIRAFSALKSTWKNIAPKEDKKSGLIIEFPKANQISNGERDIICFVALLKQAKLKFKKKKCILVIDEIFDYLDDANLVACQYYLTQMIGEMKADGRQLFPIIMTHLNPKYFKNFSFSDQKVQYLNRTVASDKAVENIIIKRTDPLIVDSVAKHFLHFHPDEKDLSEEFQHLELSSKISTAMAFNAHVINQLDRYLNDQNYDPVAVCCAVRLQIEKRVYTELSPEHELRFLATNKTVDKLAFAAENGVTVPEVFYLLGLIYNEAMHLRANQDNVSPLASKLANLTIKHMVIGLRET